MTDDLTPGESEAVGAETVTFSHFDQEWTIPAQLRLSHRLAMRRDPSMTGMCIAVLSSEDLDRLVVSVDPTDEQLDEFTDAMSVALGFKGSGNS